MNFKIYIVKIFLKLHCINVTFCNVIVGINEKKIVSCEYKSECNSFTSYTSLLSIMVSLSLLNAPDCSRSLNSFSSISEAPDAGGHVNLSHPSFMVFTIFSSRSRRARVPVGPVFAAINPLRSAYILSILVLIPVRSGPAPLPEFRILLIAFKVSLSIHSCPKHDITISNNPNQTQEQDFVVAIIRNMDLLHSKMCRNVMKFDTDFPRKDAQNLFDYMLRDTIYRLNVMDRRIKGNN